MKDPPVTGQARAAERDPLSLDPLRERVTLKRDAPAVRGLNPMALTVELTAAVIPAPKEEVSPEAKGEHSERESSPQGPHQER
jgi:hypothetical protein